MNLHNEGSITKVHYICAKSLMICRGHITIFSMVDGKW